MNFKDFTPLQVNVIGSGESEAIFDRSDMAHDHHLRATNAVIIMDGTVNKNPTITLYAKQPDGKLVGIETTYKLFNAVVKVAQGRAEFEGKNIDD